MIKWNDLNSKIISLRLDHVDTDMIIPAQFLTSTSKTGYAKGLFKRLRDEDPEFVLNTEVQGDKSILLAGHNFGCGSSREHAVWALTEYGIRCVIAKSFGDIFKANALKNGLLAISLDELEVDQLFEEKNQIRIVLSEQKIIRDGGAEIKFEIDPFRKYCLLEGLDDLDYILDSKSEIDTYRRIHSSNKYFDTNWIRLNG